MRWVHFLCVFPIFFFFTNLKRHLKIRSFFPHLISDSSFRLLVLSHLRQIRHVNPEFVSRQKISLYAIYANANAYTYYLNIEV